MKPSKSEVLSASVGLGMAPVRADGLFKGEPYHGGQRVTIPFMILSGLEREKKNREC
jgi:hypothetical protein